MKIVSKTNEITFDDVLILPGKSDFTIDQETKHITTKSKISKNVSLELPIISSPMPGISEDEMAIAMAKNGAISFIHCFQSYERQFSQVEKVKKQNLSVGVSIQNLDKQAIDYIKKLAEIKVDLISIETANAHNKQTIEFVKKVKKAVPNIDLSVSLLVTAEGVEELIKAGADGIRVGIGGGSHCTTRLVTGVGRPQLSTLAECSKVTKKYNIPLISDTGIKYAGDISKAIAFGADAVMIGGLLSGTKECPGDIVYKDGLPYKMSWGMCTDTAITQKQIKILGTSTIEGLKYEFKRFLGLVEPSDEKVFEEGVENLVKYKGSVNTVLKDLKSGLIRSMWYIGAKNFSELKKKAKIVTISSNTNYENVPRI